MIERTFIHCKGIGPTHQKKLEKVGLNNWDSVLNNSQNLPFNGKLATHFVNELTLCKQALTEKNIHLLVNKFPTKEQWRIVADFFEEASYFDIETTGFAEEVSQITLIVCYHKGKLYNFVKDENLDEFLDLLEDIELLLSFNGSSFDVPHVLNSFHIPEIPCPHIDLRWLCYHCNFRHGLKNIEMEMDIKRPDDLKGVDGLEAVYLWQHWENSRDVKSRQKLIRYCRADVLSLKLVAARILEEHGFEINPIDKTQLWEMIDS